jgi:MFS family permease|tara:strand:- start:112 stop:1425 length:1314 start_codon:yes stop_codon:yes gene_type:complete
LSKPEEDNWPSAIEGWVVTILLLIAFTFSFVDRQVLNLLVEPIRLDLQVTDTQISFLQGLAFAVTYILMSVPLGRMVDKYNRVGIMIGGVLVWSATTIACGLSKTYSQLLFARFGVGAGEAALSPAAWSVLADYFRPNKLALPISVYLMGPYLGAGLAMIAGAEVLDWSRDVEEVSLPIVGVVAPWQATFIAVGLPGVLIAGLLATIREPKRKGRLGALTDVPGWRAVLRYMWQRKKVYAALHLGVPFIVVMLYGLQGWTPTILLRVYGWDLADAGRIYGTLALVAGSAGVLTGPVLSRYLLGRGVLDAPLRVAVLGAGMATFSLMTLPFQSSGEMALVSIGCASFFVTLPLALITTVMQEVTPNNMRGVVNGMYVVTTNVVGLALGPTLVAASTDYIFQDTMAVAKSLALVAVFVGPIAVYLLNQGRQSYVELEAI